MDDLCKKFPELLTLEMENFHLFHLAKLCKGTIKAAAASVPLANRSTLEFIDGPHAEKRMRMACKIALDAMASFKIPDDKVMPGAVFHLE